MDRLKKISIGFGVVFMILLIPITVSAQSTEIPTWVKGVANFWVEGNISDQEFGEAISFLIEQNIVQVKMPNGDNTELQNKIEQLEKENSELRSIIKNNNINDKQIINIESEFNSEFPSINEKYSGTDANEKIKALLSFHNNITESQRLELISRDILKSEFVFVMAYDGKWNVIYMKGNDGISDEGNGTTLIPFDCSHNMNYMQLFNIQKIDEFGLISGMIFKNGVAIAYDSSDKPYAIFAIATFCDTGFDVNETYLKTISWEELN